MLQAIARAGLDINSPVSAMYKNTGSQCALDPSFRGGGGGLMGKTLN